MVVLKRVVSASLTSSPVLERKVESRDFNADVIVSTSGVKGKF